MAEEAHGRSRSAMSLGSMLGGGPGGMERDLGQPGDMTVAGLRLTKIEGTSTRMELVSRRFEFYRYGGLFQTIPLEWYKRENNSVAVPRGKSVFEPLCDNTDKILCPEP